MLYATCNTVWLDGEALKVWRGALQGDSLAPLLHAIVLRAVWARVVADGNIDGVLDIWYADDGTFFRRLSRLRRAFEGLQRHGPPAGILMGGHKLQLVVPGVEAHDSSGLPDIGDARAWCVQHGGVVSHDGATIMGVPVGDEPYVAAYAAWKTAALRQEYRAIESLHHPIMELALVRAVMTYKVNHVLRGRPPSQLESVIASHDALQRESLTRLLRMAPRTQWPKESVAILQQPLGSGGLGIVSAKISAHGAYIGARHQTPALLRDLLRGAEPPIPEESLAYLESWARRVGTEPLRYETLPSFDAAPRSTRVKVQHLINGAEAKVRRKELDAWAEGDTRLRAHWTSIRADPQGCLGFLRDYSSWDPGRYNTNHYPDDDVHRAARVAICRTLSLPIVAEGTRCAGCLGELDPHADHALVCTVGSGGQMAAYKTSRHNDVVGVLYTLGKASGLSPGSGILKEVHLGSTPSRPSDIHVRPRTHVRFLKREDRDMDVGDLAVAGAGAVAEQARHAVGDANFRDVAYDVTIVATQKISCNQFGYLIATTGVGAEARKATRDKKRKFRDNVRRLEQWGGPGPRAESRLRFQPLAFESSGYTAPPVKALLDEWGRMADKRLGPGRSAPARSCAQHQCSSAIHYWNSVCLILRSGDGLLVEKSLHLIGREGPRF
jgi:hypothetical protein